MIQRSAVVIAILGTLMGPAALRAGDDYVEIPADVLADKIRGGLLAQILGNLNGLPHEMKYNLRPGKVEHYTPALPEGARTDDDTDIEWVYIVEMQRSGEVLLSPAQIIRTWERHINDRIWCANRYARGLMSLGFEPPETGRIALNPWSEFNISGQFVCEAFGLVAPAMPQAAARIGLHYTHVTIDGEPAQTTQLFTGMIATAFVEEDVEKLVEAGLAMVDPASEIHRVVTDVREWWRENPNDWHRTWDRIRAKYMRHDGTIRDINGHELNTAAIIGSLLYGRGDLVETLRLAFCFGWDADCNAATAGTMLGVIRGRKWMDAQGWTIDDRYENTCRPGMPTDETVTRYADRIADVARNVILANGGEETTADGRRVLRIRRQPAANVEPLARPDERLVALRKHWLPRIERELTGTTLQRARAAYLALCLGEAERLMRDRPREFAQAIEALNTFPDLVKNLFQVPEPTGAKLQAAAKAAGL